MKEARWLQGLSKWFQGNEQEASFDSPEAFSALYEQSYRAVYRYLLGMHSGPVEDAEDLAAETFIRAWKARRSFTGDPNHAVGWLLRIARRLVIDAHRRRQARIQPEVEATDTIPAVGPIPETALQEAEQRQVLWRLLHGLPNEQREMLVLRYLLDWRIRQIGEHLEIAENTVSVTIHRTLLRLQRDWPQEKEADDARAK